MYIIYSYIYINIRTGTKIGRHDIKLNITLHCITPHGMTLSYVHFTTYKDTVSIFLYVRIVHCKYAKCSINISHISLWFSQNILRWRLELVGLCGGRRLGLWKDRHRFAGEQPLGRSGFRFKKWRCDPWIFTSLRIRENSRLRITGAQSDLNFLLNLA